MKPIMVFTVLVSGLIGTADAADETWVVVDTGQDRCYSDRAEIHPPAPGGRFFGQDAQHSGTAPSYRDNRDGTVTDLNTGLQWSKAVDSRKLSLAEATASASDLRLGGFTDWRVPNIKELYSLIDFRGRTGLATPESKEAPRSAIPYLNTDFFDFRYGGPGERFIDAQWLSSTRYVSKTMHSNETIFGVNFADGRIKGYGTSSPDPMRPEKKFYVRYVRGNPYGANHFLDNGDGTVTDQATGLIWTKADSGIGMNWEQALRYAAGLHTAGHTDWRLPNAKELQSLVDYSRSPDTTSSPAIASVFQTTPIVNEAGVKDWPFFWTSTTHSDGPDESNAVYVAFGRAMGSMHGEVMDVHGAGAQRSDPKNGKASIGHGPQGDARRGNNFVRCVRSGLTSPRPSPTLANGYPNWVRVNGESYRPESPDAATSKNSPGIHSKSKASPFVQRLDRDGDGRVSLDEFDGPREHFPSLDKNQDGYLTAEEAPPPPPGGHPPKP